MRTLISAAFLSMLVAVVGCHNDKDEMKSDKPMKSSDMAMKDDCSHCDGVQHMSADGTCPVCHMKLSGGGNAAKY